MTTKADLHQAAQRHFDDGHLLESSKRYSGAGYHFGLSAECAIKSRLSGSGIPDGDAVMWQHFPPLVATARQVAHGRVSASFAAILNKASLMSGWEIKMRYAKNGMVSERDAAKWKSDANSLLGELV